MTVERVVALDVTYRELLKVVVMVLMAEGDWTLINVVDVDIAGVAAAVAFDAEKNTVDIVGDPDAIGAD